MKNKIILFVMIILIGIYVFAHCDTDVTVMVIRTQPYHPGGVVGTYIDGNPEVRQPLQTIVEHYFYDIPHDTDGQYVNAYAKMGVFYGDNKVPYDPEINPQIVWVWLQ